MATMTACAIGNRLDAVAQAVPDATGNAPAPQRLPVRRFHIVAGPLDTALEAYRLQSGIGFKIALRPDQVATLQTAGLQGLYTPQTALRELLSGTGLSCTFDNSDHATINLAHSDTIDVTAQLPAVSMGRFTEDVLHTPQTVAVVPEFVLHDEQNRTLSDAIRNVPGISIAAGRAGPRATTSPSAVSPRATTYF